MWVGELTVEEMERIRGEIRGVRVAFPNPYNIPESLLFSIRQGRKTPAILGQREKPLVGTVVWVEDRDEERRIVSEIRDRWEREQPQKRGRRG
jgi:hypothetical protein